VFFATSRGAFESYRKIGFAESSLWVCAGVLSAPELASLRAEGLSVSEFNYAIESEGLAGIDRAIETIREHHPGLAVWVGV
jgi:hypothetical protein